MSQKVACLARPCWFQQYWVSEDGLDRNVLRKKRPSEVMPKLEALQLVCCLSKIVHSKPIIARKEAIMKAIQGVQHPKAEWIALLLGR
jgi:hypothetical protein